MKTLKICREKMGVRMEERMSKIMHTPVKKGIRTYVRHVLQLSNSAYLSTCLTVVVEGTDTWTLNTWQVNNSWDNSWDAARRKTTVKVSNGTMNYDMLPQIVMRRNESSIFGVNSSS